MAKQGSYSGRRVIVNLCFVRIIQSFVPVDIHRNHSLLAIDIYTVSTAKVNIFKFSAMKNHGTYIFVCEATGKKLLKFVIGLDP